MCRPSAQSETTIGVGHRAKAICAEGPSCIALYSCPFGIRHAITYQARTLRFTSSRPSSGEWRSPFVSRRRRTFVRKPTEQKTTLRSGAAASALR